MSARGAEVARLLDVMARLRDRERGCPWDVEQTFETIAPYTIEEAYEVDDAIRRGDRDALREELGDLLLQVVYHARMAEEEGVFDFDHVVRGLCEKLVRRHPHVFGDATVASAAAQTEAWEEHKARERAQSARQTGEPPSALDGVARGLPALLRAQKLARRARRAGLSDGTLPSLAQARAAARALGGAPSAEDATSAAASVTRLLAAALVLALEHELDAETLLREDGAAREARLRDAERARRSDRP